ncbi:MAG: hypothetical protein ACRDGM_07860 [bacterium]
MTPVSASKVVRIKGRDTGGVERTVKTDTQGRIVLSDTITISSALLSLPLANASDAMTLPLVGGTYAAQDEVSDSAVGAMATPLNFANVVDGVGKSGYIVKAILESVSGAATFVVTNAVFRLWLFNAAPTTMFGNDSAFQLDAADKAKRVGYVDFALVTEGTGSDTGYGLDDGLRMAFTCDAGDVDLYGVLVAKAAYVWTASQTFDVFLTIEGA